MRIRIVWLYKIDDVALNRRTPPAGCRPPQDNGLAETLRHPRLVRDRDPSGLSMRQKHSQLARFNRHYRRASWLMSKVRIPSGLVGRCSTSG